MAKYKDLKEKVDIAILLSIFILFVLFYVHAVPYLVELYMGVEVNSFIKGLLTGIVGTIVAIMFLIVFAYFVVDGNGR